MPNIMYLENKNFENDLKNAKKFTDGNWIINKKEKVPMEEKN